MQRDLTSGLCGRDQRIACCATVTYRQPSLSADQRVCGGERKWTLTVK